jgi:hypothetical protein
MSRVLSGLGTRIVWTPGDRWYELPSPQQFPAGVFLYQWVESHEYGKEANEPTGDPSLILWKKEMA